MIKDLTRQVVGHLVLRMSVFVGLALGLVIAAPFVRDHVQPTRAVEQATVLPIWSAADAAAFPGCVSPARWDRTSAPLTLVVHRFDVGREVRMGSDAAWARNHDGTESNDVWVLGACH